MTKKTHVFIPCMNCGKETIEIDETPSSLSEKRGFTGKKGLYLYKGHTNYLTKRCSNCGWVVGQKKQIDHEERLRRLREAGIPMQIEEKIC